MAGAERFISDRIDARDDWEWHVESLHEAGDKVVAILRRSGCSKTRRAARQDALRARVHAAGPKADPHEMYADPGKALEAVGLST